MNLDLQKVMTDEMAQILVKNIMVSVGLKHPSDFYAGPDAKKIRLAAANQLSKVIADQAHSGVAISPPVEDLIKFVKATALNLEKCSETLRLTYEVMQIAVYGHIWIGRLLAQKAKKFDCIMAKDGTLAILKNIIGFGSMYGGTSCQPGGGCDDGGNCNSGGCGSGGCGSCGP
ncbi:hypothetical protein KKC47_01950 [Patescibacteria group bacterium]|nr:hypothetical protein [Patescibacteria group bacterium]